ncbi:hypothetical protein MMC10_004737 [Thelotrema lepadinum]|nr:hypothetical protein [Thelotrema lepadinum]
MERGFQFNIEQGFNSIVKASPKSTLLSYMNTLDRRLESLLSGNKAETIKFVPNAYKSNNLVTSGHITGSEPILKDIKEVTPVKQAEPSYSSEQRAHAATRREAETRQLEARLGRQPLFSRSSDGIAYTLPIDPRRRLDLPVPLQVIKTICLFVPLLYPLLPCRIALQGVARDAATSTEKAFEKKAKECPETTLMGHINFLATNMHTLAFDETEQNELLDADSELGFEMLDLHDEDGHESSDRKGHGGTEFEERTHVHVIPRPPEWTLVDTANSDGESDEMYDYEYTSSDEEVIDAAENAKEQPERGVSIEFPNIELYGVEVLELTSLSLVVKCLRCKESMDVNNLRYNATSPRQESCKKCTSVLSLGNSVYETI